MLKLIKLLSITNILTTGLLFYLFFHLVYGKYNVGNFLVNEFHQELLEKDLINLNKEILSIDKDLFAIYSNYDDFIDEVEKQKYESTSKDEVLIKIN
jgi:cell division protein FtsB